MARENKEDLIEDLTTEINACFEERKKFKDKLHELDEKIDYLRYEVQELKRQVEAERQAFYGGEPI